MGKSIGGTKVCRDCGKVQLLSFYYWMRSAHGKRVRYPRPECKQCFWDAAVARRKLNGPKERARQRDWYRRRRAVALAKRHRHKNPIKERARSAVAHALRAGRLQRPKKCSCCGRRGIAIEAHHPDYTKPLQVKWLCRICHAAQGPKPVGNRTRGIRG